MIRLRISGLVGEAPSTLLASDIVRTSVLRKKCVDCFVRHQGVGFGVGKIFTRTSIRRGSVSLRVTSDVLGEFGTEPDGNVGDTAN
jgi:hypothetical protein